MACINPDGTLSTVARRTLERLASPTDLASLVADLGLPLWRVRATLRETGRAGLVIANESVTPATFRISDLGREALEIDHETTM